MLAALVVRMLEALCGRGEVRPVRIHRDQILKCTSERMEWTREQTLMLIELYREQPVLWDPTKPDYKNRTKKSDAWKTLADVMGIDRAEVERKIRSLLAQFRRELKKVKERKSGDSAEQVYTSSWFAFKSLWFVADKNKPRHTYDAGLQVST